MVHQTSKVLYPFTGQYIDIDNGLISVMLTLWAAGYETCQSCQDGVIVFNDHYDYDFTHAEQIMRDYTLNVHRHTCDDCVWENSPYVIYNFEGV